MLHVAMIALLYILAPVLFLLLPKVSTLMYIVLCLLYIHLVMEIYQTIWLKYVEYGISSINKGKNHRHRVDRFTKLGEATGYLRQIRDVLSNQVRSNDNVYVYYLLACVFILDFIIPHCWTVWTFFFFIAVFIDLFPL